MQESELPELYRRDFDAEVIDGSQSEQPLSRRRNVVHYDDGLTEDQFLRALEGDQDLNEVVERKRERAEKRRLKQAGLADVGDADVSASDSPRLGRKRAKGTDDTDESTGTQSPADGALGKRKLGGSSSAMASSTDVSDALNKRRKVDESRDAIKSALMQCYHAVEHCEDPETGRRRCVLFIDIPKKSEYPDYHVLIANPIAMRQIRKRIENRTYKTLEACKKDFHLMFNNARTYNQEGSLVWNDAEELQRVFDETYARVQQELEAQEEGDQTATEADESQAEAPVSLETSMDAEEGEPPRAPAKTGMKIKLSMAGRKKRTP